MANAPIISVVTPSRNAATSIARCLASVASQRQSGIEHIVVDGGSTDGTTAIAAAAGVSLISEPDAGIYDAMSKGVRLARGKYVHILNADDQYAHPEALSRAVTALEINGWDLVHARTSQVDAEDRVVRVFGQAIDKRGLLRKMRVAHPTVVVRRSVYERFGAFSVGFRIAGDHEFVLRVWDKVRIGYLDEVMTTMALGGVSTKNANVARAYRESMAAAIIHGARPIPALARCWYEVVKHRLFFSRRFARSVSACSGGAQLLPVR